MSATPRRDGVSAESVREAKRRDWEWLRANDPQWADLLRLTASVFGPIERLRIVWRKESPDA